MEKHSFIKMIEGNGSPSSLRKSDGSRRSTTLDLDGTDIDAWASGTDILPGRKGCDK